MQNNIKQFSLKLTEILLKQFLEVDIPSIKYATFDIINCNAVTDCVLLFVLLVTLRIYLTKAAKI